jgi:hypothetical protein
MLTGAFDDAALVVAALLAAEPVVLPALVAAELLLLLLLPHPATVTIRTIKHSNATDLSFTSLSSGFSLAEQ